MQLKAKWLFIGAITAVVLCPAAVLAQNPPPTAEEVAKALPDLGPVDRIDPLPVPAADTAAAMTAEQKKAEAEKRKADAKLAKEAKKKEREAKNEARKAELEKKKTAREAKRAERKKKAAEREAKRAERMKKPATTFGKPAAGATTSTTNK